MRVALKRGEGHSRSFGTRTEVSFRRLGGDASDWLELPKGNGRLEIVGMGIV